MEIAYGSALEVVSEAFVARRQGFLPEEHFKQLYAAAEELARMMSGLRTSLLKT